MKRTLILSLSLVLFFLISVSSSQAQTRRALLIGIDVYQPANIAEVQKTRGGWTNLDGCVNDANAVGEIIKSRFGFEEPNITRVFDQQASREKIIAELERLITESQKGDVVFIYFAGHGSQVYNSLSTEVSGDKQDETIVPADMIDIRDKELAKLFNRLIDKGVILTMIFDSCHSGSIARGSLTPEIAKTRHINGSGVDAQDASDPPKPEDRGALIFSAAQPEQLAKEAKDDQGNPHGAFTIALIKALNSSAADEPAEILFLRLKAIMQANGSTQEPVLGGNPERRKNGLFGADLGKNAGKTIVAVLKAGDDAIELQGGWAIGLAPGCELKKLGSTASETITISKVEGMARCKASLKTGQIANIKAGDLFEITKWCAAGKPNLRVWLPEANLSIEQISRVSKNLAPLATNKNIKWVTDPTTTPATHTILYSGNSWKLSCPGGVFVDLGNDPTAETVLKKVPRNASLFLQLPPSAKLKTALKIGSDSENSGIAISDDALTCDYILCGSPSNGNIRYAWIRPGIAKEDTSFQSTLPLRTDWFAVNAADEAATASQLTQYALRLGKVNAWLNLSSPPDDGSYPFNLALKNTRTGAFLTAGTVTEGEEYSLVLLTDQERLKKWMGKSRYVYVFTIDINGKTQQIFPFQNTGNEGNKLPAKNYEFANEISLGNVTFTITEPFGVDSYFLVTSDEAVNNFQAFNSEGVITRGAPGSSDLETLLNSVGTASRGVQTTATPVNWSFQRIAITSKSAKP
jgi:hypothetical protein